MMQFSMMSVQHITTISSAHIKRTEPKPAIVWTLLCLYPPPPRGAYCKDGLSQSRELHGPTCMSV
jgi:hypothetical protein